MPQRP